MSSKAAAGYGLAVIALLTDIGCALQLWRPCLAFAALEPPSGQLAQSTLPRQAVGAMERDLGRRILLSPVTEIPEPKKLSFSQQTLAEDALPDLTLAAAIQLALSANPDLRSAGERTRMAEETLARARADFFPILALNETYEASNNPARRFYYLQSQGVVSPAIFFNQPNTVDNLHSQVHFQQEFFHGGQRLSQTRAAEAEHQAALFSLAAAQNRIVYQVAEAYYRLFQARELVKVRRQAVTQVESHQKAVLARFNAGTAVKSDVLQVEVRLAEVREALITARNNLQLAWAVLENVTGARLAGQRLPNSLSPGPWAEHISEVELAVSQALHGSAEDNGVESAVAEAMQRRPELSAAISRRQAAEERVRSARAEKYPIVGFVADYDVFNGSTGNGTDSFFVGLACSLNLFNAGRTQASVRRAEAHVREIMARNRRLELDIELEIRTAHLQLKDARERIQVAASAVNNAGEELRQIESQFNNQTATVTQLIDAQVGLLNAQVRQTNAQAEAEIARSALERAIGRLSEFLQQ